MVAVVGARTGESRGVGTADDGAGDPPREAAGVENADILIVEGILSRGVNGKLLIIVLTLTSSVQRDGGMRKKKEESVSPRKTSSPVRSTALGPPR